MTPRKNNPGANPIRRLQPDQHPVPQTVKEALAQYRPQLEKALPPDVSIDRYMQVANTAINAIPDLAECERGSVMLSLLRCCQLGLEPSTPLGHVYIVPFYDKKRKCKIATVIIGYKGYIDLAWRSDGILVKATVVKEGDRFDYQLGTDPWVKHKRAPAADRGDVTHAYAVATMPDGRTTFEVMDVEELEAAMMRSQSKGEWGPWKTDRERMQRKSPIRRLVNDLPLNPDRRHQVATSAHAVAYDDAAYDPSVLQLPESAAGRPLFKGARGALPAEPTSIDLPDPEPTPEPQRPARVADVARAVAAASPPETVSDTAAAPAEAKAEAPKEIVLVDTDTFKLVGMVDWIDWQDDDTQEEAFQALKAAIVDNPAYGKNYLLENAEILGGFTESRKAALRSAVEQAKALASRKPDTAPAAASKAAADDDDDDFGWAHGL